MATNKQVRRHYKKCRRYFWLLQKALNDAHDCGLIDYEQYGKPPLPSACGALSEAKKNFESAVEKQLYYTLRNELMNELKGVW